jgi:hypothetical protein
VLNNNLVSKLAIKDFQKLEVNFISLSNMLSLGMWCGLNIYFMKILAISISLQVDLTGMKRASLLNFSTTTMMVSFSLANFGNPMMKYMEMVFHFHSTIGRGCNNHVGCHCSTLTY